MPLADQIIIAKWVLSGEHPIAVLENHAVVIEKDLIKAILPAEIAKERYPSARISVYPYHVLMPGFVNAHTHLGMNYFRGLGCDLPLMDWLNDYIWPAEKAHLSDDFVHDAALFAMAEMIRSGSTCFNDMFYFPKAIARAADAVGLRGAVSIHLIDFPTPWTKDTAESLAKGREFFDEYQHHPLIRATVAPHAPYTVSDQSFHQAQAMAMELGLKMNVHLHETQAEIDHSLTHYHKRPIQRLQDLGLLSPNLIAIHCSQLDDSDLDILAATKPNIVHCPSSNMKLASGICPVETLRARGINVALGTDSVASNNNLDMINELRIAGLLAKVSNMNPESLKVDALLSMASINGARALGMEDQIGSLKPGKSADMIAINLDDLDTLPVFDPLVQIAYAASRHQVSDLWVAGKQLMKARTLLTIDEQGLRDKVRHWRVYTRV